MPVDSLCRQMTTVAIGIGYSVTIKTVMKNLTFVASLQCFRQVRLQPACSAKTYPIYRFQIENLTVFLLSADKIMMQRT